MRMKWVLLLIVGAAILAGSLLAHATKEDRHMDVGLWLARSCVGEAGFTSSETGECAAILHIYAKRAKISGKSIYKIARKYSAALKERKGYHANKWVLGLRRDLSKPANWHPSLRWKPHRIWWELMLEHVDDFLDGKVADPVPKAMHYGGAMDRGRLSPRVWRRITGLPFLNLFYEIRIAKYRDGWLKGYKPTKPIETTSLAQ